MSVWEADLDHCDTVGHSLLTRWKGPWCRVSSSTTTSQTG